MTFDELLDFISSSDRMKMSAVYQPAVIRALISAGGSATVRQLAHALLGEDESQLLYYESILKKMPIPVLKKHGVLTRAGDLVTLNTRKLTLEQRAQLRLACEQRLQDYIHKRGLSIWDHRLLEPNPVSDSLRYEVLKRGKGRCELCGTTKDDAQLDVDHIIPKARGGKNELANLQVLCAKCNRTKRHLDDTDFRNNLTAERNDSCPFCAEELGKRIVETNGTAVAITDLYPVTPGHTLIIPLRHTPNYFSMTEVERSHAEELTRYMRNRIAEQDKEVTGFNIGSNSGLSAGQTVMHAHIHLIPRRDGDVANPRGGVRGVIPRNQSY